jgi:hypothetical protein
MLLHFCLAILQLHTPSTHRRDATDPISTECPAPHLTGVEKWRYSSTIVNIRTASRWAVSFTLRLRQLYVQESGPCSLWARNRGFWIGPRGGVGIWWRKYRLCLPGIEPRILGRLPYCSVAVTNLLYRLRWQMSNVETWLENTKSRWEDSVSIHWSGVRLWTGFSSTWTSQEADDAGLP